MPLVLAAPAVASGLKCQHGDVVHDRLSALFALCVAYTIWYAAVREIGSARTSVYSNLVPIVAMVDRGRVPAAKRSALRKLVGVADSGRWLGVRRSARDGTLCGARRRVTIVIDGLVKEHYYSQHAVGASC